MIRGYYTAASGLVTQEKKLNAVANNIANVSTVGFKRDNIIMGTFGEHMTQRMNAYQNTDFEEIGPAAYMQIVNAKYLDHTQGGFESTSRHLDVAIMGDGFFIIQGEDGQDYLTRDGQFSVDAEGYLVLPGFGRVQGEAGDIELETTYNIRIDERGMILVTDEEENEEEELTRLMIAMPEDYTENNMRKVATGLYECDVYALFDPDDVDDFDLEAEGPQFTMPTIRQFCLEKSNVDMSDEMTKMIASQRQLQSCSQIVKMYDEMANQITGQISRV